MFDGEPPQIDPSAWICPVMEQAIELGAAELSLYEAPVLVHAAWENELHVVTLMNCDFWQGGKRGFVYANRVNSDREFQPMLGFLSGSDPGNWSAEQLNLPILVVGYGHHSVFLTVDFEWVEETWSVSRCEQRIFDPRAEARLCQDE